MIVCPCCRTIVALDSKSLPPVRPGVRFECLCRKLSCHDFGPDRATDWWFEVDSKDVTLAMNLSDDGSFYYSEDFQRFNPDVVRHEALREFFVDTIVLAAQASSVLDS